MGYPDLAPGENFDYYLDDFGHELECTICGGDGGKNLSTPDRRNSV